MPPSAAHFGARSPTMRRILREAAELSSSPSPDYTAAPLESDLFEWHFTLRGPPNSVFSQGIYHGRITLPNTYPLRPPNFRFTTPNGRFETNREICLSISGHHEETWQPAWGIRTAIVALRSFMETDAKGQLGGLETPEATRVQLAQESGAFTCPVCAKSNFEIITESEKSVAEADSTSQDVEVPSELNLGWKDEMAGAKTNPAPAEISPPQREMRPTKAPAAPATPVTSQDRETAELAEGFVPTAPIVPPAVEGGIASTSRPSLSEVTTNRTVRTAVQGQAPVPPETPVRPRDNNVPLWLDRAIMVLVVLLFALVLKVMSGV